MLSCSFFFKIKYCVSDWILPVATALMPATSASSNGKWQLIEMTDKCWGGTLTSRGRSGVGLTTNFYLKVKGILCFPKSNCDYKFYITAGLHVNVGFHSGAEWEVTGGEAANEEQRSSCIRGTARAQGSTWRTEPSDLLPATSSHPLLLSQKNTHARCTKSILIHQPRF